MTTAAPPTSPRKYANAADWWHGLGDVPLERIIMDPLPGTATESDLLRFVERQRRLCELVDGTLVEKPAGSFESLIAVRIITYLNAFVEAGKLGIVLGPDGMWRLAGGQVRLPDVAFISRSRLPAAALSLDAILPVSPDLAVEVISEGNTKTEMQGKLQEYFASGVRQVWFVYPKTNRVAVFVEPSDEPAQLLGESDVLDGGDLLPDFELSVAKIFASIL